jgi:hypothetical protein
MAASRIAEQSSGQWGALRQHVRDALERDRRHRRVRQGCNRIQRAPEQAGLQAEDFAGQHEVHDLPAAIVKDLVPEQPSVVIGMDRVMAGARHDDVPVLGQAGSPGVPVAGRDQLPTRERPEQVDREFRPSVVMTQLADGDDFLGHELTQVNAERDLNHRSCTAAAPSSRWVPRRPCARPVRSQAGTRSIHAAGTGGIHEPCDDSRP